MKSTLIFCVLLIALANLGFADVSDHLIRGDVYRMRGQLAQAEGEYQKALKLDPDSTYARNWLGWIYAKGERYPEAIREFDRSISISRDIAFPFLWKGIILLRLGKLKDAKSAFAEVIDLDPMEHKARYFLGFIATLGRETTTALAHLDKAVSLDPNEPDMLCRLARLYSNLGMPYNALLLYRKAIRRDRRFIQAYNELGWIYYNLGDEQLAVRTWEQSLKVNPNQITAKRNLAKFYNASAWRKYQKGDNEPAIEDWRKALQYQPDDKAAKFYLRKVRATH